MDSRNSLLIVGTGLFILGSLLATHHTHQIINKGSEAKEFILYSIIGLGLLGIGTNILTDIAQDHMCGMVSW